LTIVCASIIFSVFKIVLSGIFPKVLFLIIGTLYFLFLIKILLVTLGFRSLKFWEYWLHTSALEFILLFFLTFYLELASMCQFLLKSVESQMVISLI
jgi:hypothetical protein